MRNISAKYELNIYIYYKQNIIHDMYNTHIMYIIHYNMTTCKSSQGIGGSPFRHAMVSPSGAHALIAVPGGVDGPSGVLVGLPASDGSWVGPGGDQRVLDTG